MIEMNPMIGLNEQKKLGVTKVTLSVCLQKRALPSAWLEAPVVENQILKVKCLNEMVPLFHSCNFKVDIK